MKDQLKSQYDKNQLSDSDWEKAARVLLNSKFDEERAHQYRELLQEAGISRQAPRIRRLPLLKKIAAFAASVLLICAVGWYVLVQQNDIQYLASTHLEKPFIFDNGSVRGEAAIEANRGKAAEAYQSGAYEKALNYLRKIEVEQAANAADYFQMGLSLMYQKEANYQGALNAFAAVRKSNPAIYDDEINWFSALCYIMLSNEAEAQQYLQKVIDSKGSRQQAAARNLLEKMTTD